MILEMVSYQYCFIFLCLGFIIPFNQVLSQADIGDYNKQPQSTPTSTVIKPKLVSGYSLGGRKLNNQVNIQIIRDRMNKGGKVVTGIVSSFAGSGDRSTLEDAFSKYDELMEEIEADLTKAKIGLGLRLEESLKNYKKSTDKFFYSLRSLSGTNSIYWNNQANYFPTLDEKDLRRRVMQLNGVLSQGFENFLEMSERGKDVLRRLYKRRYEMMNGISPRRSVNNRKN